MFRLKRCHIVKMSKQTKENYKFNTTPIKILMTFFATIQNSILNHEISGTLKSQSNLKKELGDLTFPEFKI